MTRPTFLLHSFRIFWRVHSFRLLPRGVSVSLLLLTLTLAGCGWPNEPADLVIVNGADPASLDPAYVTGNEGLRVVGALFEGLTRRDPVTATPEPGLAESWTVSEDGLVYHFRLREGLKWSTGEEITSADVVYSWRRVLAPETAAQYAGQLYCLRNGAAYNQGTLTDPTRVGVRSLDARIVRVDLTQPLPYFLDLCAFQTLSVVPRSSIDRHGDQWIRARPLPASGAYELESWRLNDRIRLRRNPNYWDADNVPSDLIDLLTCSSTTALNLYESGVVDVIWDQDMIPSELVSMIKNRADYHSFNYLGTFFLRFNTTRAPLNDARVRRALALSIDKARIVERIIQGGEAIATHLVPRGIAGYDPPAGLDYDPEGARRWLAEAGFPQGRGFPSMRFLFSGSGGGAGKVQAKIAVEIQAMWRQELGIRVELRQMEKKAYFAAQNALDYDVSSSNWIGDYNDPSTFLDLFQSDNGNNRTGWGLPEYDRLIRESSRELHPERRSQLMRRAETLLISEEMPIAPIYFFIGFTLYRPDQIHGLHGNILNHHPLRAIYKSAPAN